MDRFLDFPFRIEGRGQTARSDEDDHLRDLIHQVLFTAPGERVNRPDFGCGLLQLTFQPNDSAMAIATQFLVHGALTRWLDHLIKVEAVDVQSEDSTLLVRVVYSKRSSGELSFVEVSHPEMIG